MGFFQWVMANWESLAGLLLALVAIGEIITRLTPTEKDDAMMERIGSIIRKILDNLGVPNAKKDPEKKSD